MTRYRALALALCCLTTACSSTSREARGDEQLAHDLPRLSKELGIQVPPDATVLWAERQEGLDDMTRAKLSMSRASFDRLAPTLPLRVDDLTSGSAALGTDHAGWNPDSVQGLRSGQTQLQGGRVFELGYAERDGVVTVFVVNFGT